MKNILLMSLFGLFMTVAFAGQSVTAISLVAPAYADDDSESNSNSSSDDDSELDVSDSDDSSSDEIAFSCPEGITTCYRADGSKYPPEEFDVNSLAATAAGIENDDDNEHDDDEEHDSDDDSSTTTSTTTTKYANPRHYRSF